MLASVDSGLWAAQLLTLRLGGPWPAVRQVWRIGMPVMALALLLFWVLDPTRPQPANNELLTERDALLTSNAVTGFAAWCLLMTLDGPLGAVRWVAAHGRCERHRRP